MSAEPQAAARDLVRLRELGAYHAARPDENLAELVRRDLQVDLTTRFAGRPIPHPFGKASGQLSCTLKQVEEDVRAGLGFIVLKTVIAEDESGHREMARWAEPETRMQVEAIESRSGRLGWTVTWKGRGWHGTLSEYLDFCLNAFAAGRDTDTLVIPSVKYHLPAAGEDYRRPEYEHTTKALEQVWRRIHAREPVLVEKDFSPTLAGDDRAGIEGTIVGWLEQVPALIEAAASGPVEVGVKLMNALFDDDFQRRMIQVVTSGSVRPAWLTVFNRLYDPDRGVAYGGHDLSDRNLSVLQSAVPSVPLSGTGNIVTGELMVSYALAGCENGQLHTVFQLPRSEYLPGEGSRTQCALRTLLLHPVTGLVPWLWHCEGVGLVERRDGLLHFSDLVGRGRGRGRNEG